jgi:hypothetical protein
LRPSRRKRHSYRLSVVDLNRAGFAGVSGGENPRIDGASYSGVAAFDCLFAAG